MTALWALTGFDDDFAEFTADVLSKLPNLTQLSASFLSSPVRGDMFHKATLTFGAWRSCHACAA